MSCNICFDTGNLISPCSCSILVHEECIKSWYNNIDYGKIIKQNNLCCPQCKAPGKAEFMKIFKNDQEVIDTLDILDKNSDWTHILCPSCCCVKQYAQKSCSLYINNNFRLLCSDCSPKAYKECPGCKILIEKEDGCAHMKCICGVHFCWLCLEIHHKDEIYNHIDEKHKYETELQLSYEDYHYRILQDDLKLEDVPANYWTKELILAAIGRDPESFTLIENPDKEFCLKVVKQNNDVLKFVGAYDFTQEDYKEICLEVVKQNGHALEYVCSHRFTKENYEDICLEAIEDTCVALRHVYGKNLKDGKYKEICLKAVNRDAHLANFLLNFIDKRSLTKEEYEDIVSKSMQKQKSSTNLKNNNNKYS